MAAKRIHDGSEEDPKHPDQKRLRRLPSFATVIKEVMMAKNIQNLFMAMEPLLRTVVQEELERILVQRTGFIQRPSQAQIQEIEASSLQLIFQKQLSLPIYTGKKIETVDGTPLQVLLIDRKNGLQSPLTLSSPLKLEVVVIDGCFPAEGQENWTGLEFDKHIVKERNGKRPLIIGETNLTMKDNCCCCSIFELIITDNSSWIKSRHFRIGVRVIASSYEGPRIMEAMTDRFMVKDHRGESYKKHYPPSLTDEVWRLEKIGKDGTFHKRLAAESIYTVQDFLKLLSVDPNRLRKMLGTGMSDRVWEVTVSHARTCTLGQNTYLYRGSQLNLLLSPICELKGIVAQNSTLSPQQLNKSQRDFVQQMVREAYEHWDMVEENFDGFGSVHLVENMNMAEQSQQWYSEPLQNTLPQFEIGDFDEIEEEAQNTLQRGYQNE
ncbi:calmodulin-binding protein 60 B-like [Dendrobium catenatum]|uniref:calmodulin-binding protein 60 B-like n=1 Tax=Dendrobium catenatum TaxID=906689 RepID=UPI0009F67B9A|nr:calmodulin-binding protein 60 B-like [Dendrobium catenatum]